MDVYINVLDDLVTEADENFTLTATNTADATDTANAQATIEDDRGGDNPDVDEDITASIEVLGGDVVTEDDASYAKFTVQLSNPAGYDVDANLALSGLDIGSDYENAFYSFDGTNYTPISSPITLPADGSGVDVYINVLDDLVTEADEQFTLTATNTADATDTASAQATILDNDQPPTLDLDSNDSTDTGANYQVNFTENGGAVAIADLDSSITDVDDSNIESATITLTNGQVGDVLAAGLLPAGITASVVGNVVTLSGSATLASYETAIESITFNNTSENPNTTDRIIEVVVNDGGKSSNIAIAKITVDAVTDAITDLDENVNTNE
ncbi:Calx-beta domain-containing protein, partial [Amphritea balenae]|uniref:Calx-beta domain-containing protein n=1 Tax=Amphritea balenae TaxID=452629 RepID=UPI001E344A1A